MLKRENTVVNVDNNNVLESSITRDSFVSDGVCGYCDPVEKMLD